MGNNFINSMDLIRCKDIAMARYAWKEKSEWIDGVEHVTPECIMDMMGTIKFQDTDGKLRVYVPTREDMLATDWYMI